MGDFNIEFDEKRTYLGKFNNVCDTFRHLVSQIRKPIRTNNYHQEKKFIGKTCKARKIYLNQYIYIYIYIYIYR